MFAILINATMRMNPIRFILLLSFLISAAKIRKIPQTAKRFEGKCHLLTLFNS